MTTDERFTRCEEIDLEPPVELFGPPQLSRRRAVAVLAGLGIGSTVFQRSLAAQVAAGPKISAEMIAQAEWISGITLTPDQREEVAQSLQSTLASIESLRKVAIGYEIPPAIGFRTLRHDEPAPASIDRRTAFTDSTEPDRPNSMDDLAFMSVAELSKLLRSKQLSSVELTKNYLERLRRFDPSLLCVAQFTEELALRQAEQADRERSQGNERGLLHGIPWGAKDLIAVPGYKTGWGAPQFREQQLESKATVAQRLEEAGAVLVAKLSLGALAWGDHWYGGVTRNPWNQLEGSSGSSAGSATAVAAGLVGFAIGSETLGSIVSPCTRCGVTGLRPTFGRVSRFGCMSLAWSMDKLGPIARTVEDCALIFAAIHGADGRDAAAVSRAFPWPANGNLKSTRVGYVETSKSVDQREELRILKELGFALVPFKLPAQYPVQATSMVLNVEAAAVFDSLTRSGDTTGLNRWPAVFRQAEFVPAIEYLRANRVRTLIMHEMERVFDNIDVYVGGNDVTITNLTGHPTVVLPFGSTVRDEVSVPTSLTFTGRLFGESELLSVAHAFQIATARQFKRPPLDQLVAIEKGEESKVKR